MNQKHVEHEAQSPAAADAPRTKAARKARPPIAPRGPKGASAVALIFVRAAANPKRPGSKSHTAFAQYRDGMTVQEYIDAMERIGMGKVATPNLVYDSAHGFIQIEGYTPMHPHTPKERKPRKSKKGEHAAKQATPAPTAAIEQAVVAEAID